MPSHCAFSSQLGPFQVELHLEIEPDFRRSVQLVGQIERGIGGHAALAVDQFVELGNRPSKPSSQSSLRQCLRLEEFFEEHSAGMNGIGWTRGHS